MSEQFSIVELIENATHAQGFKLPVFNQVAMEIQRAVSKDTDIRAIEAIILKDPALASEILHVANSALFSGLARLENIQQALNRLGIQQVLSIVMVAAQKQMFRAKHPYLAIMMQKLWQHATASAAGCRWIAAKYNFTDKKDSAFLAGLLHDLGSLVVLKVLDQIIEQYPDLKLTDAVIDELINSLHVDYGFRVMQSWELPMIYCEIARDHHLEQCDKKNILLQIVRLNDIVCDKVGIGMKYTPDTVLEAVPETHMLGVKAVHLAELEILLEDMACAF